MEERFDKLEQMIGSLATRFDSVDEQFKSVDRRFDDLGRSVNARFDDMNQRMDESFGDVNQRMDERFGGVNQRISVLHEDVKSDIRFTLEARQALQEVMETKFADQERSFREALAPIADAVRSSFRK